jgi:pimeloyl-ACP methyl ester carboxylesterase
LFQSVSANLRAAYDIIGLDVRGEGISQPIYCDPDIYNRPQQYIPTDEQSFRELWERNRDFAESCYNMTGPLFTHVGADQVIQDLDAVRQALGCQKLNFFGYSYGTEVGSMYAARYADKIGKIVIDDYLDHSMTVPQSYLELATALEN